MKTLLLALLLHSNPSSISSIEHSRIAAREYILAHLHLTSNDAKFENETIQINMKGWLVYQGDIDAQAVKTQYTLTVVHSDGRWTALDLNSEIQYEREKD